VIAYLLVYDIPLWLISLFDVVKGGDNNVDMWLLWLYILPYLFARVGAFLVCYVSGGEINPHHQHVFDIIKKGENEDNICHTPIFDPNYGWHVPMDPTFVRSLIWSISDVFDEISAERYFKIPHVWFRIGPSPLYLFLLVIISIF